MGKIYRRKTDRQSWSKDNMKRALTEVKNQQLSVNAASKAYNIPKAPLRRYAKKYPDEVNCCVSYILVLLINFIFSITEFSSKRWSF